MQLNRPGVFIAGPLEYGIRAEDGRCPQWECLWDIRWEQDRAAPDGWKQCRNETIRSWTTLVNSDGQINKIGPKSLKAALGWDGVRFETLETMDFSQVEVQLVVDYEEDQNGKQQLKVKWINPRDSQGGGVKKADPSAIKDLDRQYGAALRASLGTAKPANGNGRPPAQQQRKAPAASTAQPAQSTEAQKCMRDAWNAFKELHPNDNQSALAENWKKAMADYFPGKARDQITADEWIKFEADKFVKKAQAQPEPVPAGSPIGDEQHFTEDDIQF